MGSVRVMWMQFSMIIFAHQIDRVFSSTGYTLATEAAIDLHRDQFAWDAEAILVNSDEFEFSSRVLASLVSRICQK